MHKMHYFSNVATLAFMLGTACCAVAQVQFQTIALSGDSAPGTVDGAVFNSFTQPVLNDRGSFAFNATLTAGATSPVTELNRNVIYGSTGNDLKLIARTGNVAPGVTGDELLETVFSLHLNNLDEIAFRATLQSGISSVVNSSNDVAIFGPTENGLGMIAREADHVSGEPENTTYDQISNFAFNDISQVAFAARVSDGDSETPAIIGPTTNGLGVIAKAGQSAGDGIIFSPFFAGPSLNQSGDVFFRSIIFPESGDSSDESDHGIFGHVDSQTTLRLRVGDSFPQHGENAVIHGIDYMDINASGDLATFIGTVDSSATNADAQIGAMVSVIGGSTNLIASGASGIRVPDFPADARYQRFGGPEFNDRGQAAFNASIEIDSSPGAAIEAVFGPTKSGLGLVMSNEDPLGDALGGGVVRFFSTPRLNGSSDIIFHATVSESLDSPIEESRLAAFAYSQRLEEIFMVIREGDVIDVDDDPVVTDLRTIDRFYLYETFDYFSGSNAGGPNHFNDRGEMAIRLEFTDGSEGVFLASIPTVPEPASLGLIAIAIGCWSSRKHRSTASGPPC